MIDPAYYTVADGDGQTTRASSTDVDVAGHTRPGDSSPVGDYRGPISFMLHVGVALYRSAYIPSWNSRSRQLSSSQRLGRIFRRLRRYASSVAASPAICWLAYYSLGSAGNRRRMSFDKVEGRFAMASRLGLCVGSVNGTPCAHGNGGPAAAVIVEDGRPMCADHRRGYRMTKTVAARASGGQSAGRKDPSIGLRSRGFHSSRSRTPSGRRARRRERVSLPRALDRRALLV